MRPVFIIIIFLSVSGFIPAQDTISLEAVSVEAYHVSRQLRSIPGSLSVLTTDNLNTHDHLNLNALNTIPGVYMQSGTYTTNRIIIRGMGSRTPYNTNRIRTYLNDIPLTTSDGLSSPEEIDVSGIGRLEIIKGPSSALYGSGLGGNMNLYTPSFPGKMAEAAIQYGSFHTFRPAVSAYLPKGVVMPWISLSHIHSDGYRENSRYDRTSLLSTITVIPGRWKIDFLLLVLGVNSGLPSSVGKTLFENNPQAAAANWKAVNGYKKYSRGLAGITITRRLSDRTVNKTSVFARGIDSYERRPFNNLDDNSVSAGIRNKVTFHSEKTDLVTGFEWISEQYTWKLDTNSFEINHNRENRSHLNVFGMLYYQPLPSLTVSVAAAANYVRYRLNDRFSQNGDQSGTRSFPLIFSPRLGINYSPVANWSVYASAGHGFSMPSPEETLLPAGDVNPDIRHEEGWQAEIGSRFSTGNRFAMDATLYWIDLNNLLVTKRLTEDIFTGINAGKTRHYGFELMIHGKLLNRQHFPGKVYADLSYTNTLSKFISFTDDEISYDGNALPGIPDQVMFLKMLWNPVGELEIIPDIRYVGRQFLNDANTLKADGYLIANVKIQAGISLKNGRLNLYAGINNLTDKLYPSMVLVNAQAFGTAEPRYYYPGLPRNYYMGVSYRY